MEHKHCTCDVYGYCKACGRLAARPEHLIININEDLDNDSNRDCEAISE